MAESWDETLWQDYLWRARVSGERPSMAEVLRAALSGDTPCVGATMRLSGPRFLPKHFDEAMKATDAEFHDHGCRGWIVMSPLSYADVRKFGRDVLDIETCAPRPLTGASLWGYPILTTRDVGRGVAWIVGRRRDGSWARLRMETDARPELDVVFQCASLRHWLEMMVVRQRERGCTYERCDDPRRRMLGMRDVETGTSFTIPLTAVIDRPTWGIELPSNFVGDFLRTQEARDRLAWALSVGDHCLEF